MSSCFINLALSISLIINTTRRIFYRIVCYMKLIYILMASLIFDVYKCFRMKQNYLVYGISTDYFLEGTKRGWYNGIKGSITTFWWWNMLRLTISVLVDIVWRYWFFLYLVCVYVVWSSGLVWFMALNATFNNISVLSWGSVLLVEVTWVPRENQRHVASHRQTLSHNVVSSTPRHEWDSNSQL